jgi:nucleoside-triphosphatase THEP1
MMRITIAGPRAVGKTTVGKIIAEALAERGYAVEHHEEPARHPPRAGLMSVQIEETNAS